MVDVADCAAAAQALISSGRAHPDQIAIEGGSAGGFTTLAALCFSDVFRAGACRYAVCDLTAMAQDTHRFEARYLDSLVGDWPAERERYEQRSPLLHAEQITCPVLFFQGLQDKVVPPEQTQRMADALRRSGIPVEVRPVRRRRPWLPQPGNPDPGSGTDGILFFGTTSTSSHERRPEGIPLIFVNTRPQKNKALQQNSWLSLSLSSNDDHALT